MKKIFIAIVLITNTCCFGGNNRPKTIEKDDIEKQETQIDIPITPEINLIYNEISEERFYELFNDNNYSLVDNPTLDRSELIDENDSESKFSITLANGDETTVINDKRDDLMFLPKYISKYEMFFYTKLESKEPKYYLLNKFGDNISIPMPIYTNNNGLAYGTDINDISLFTMTDKNVKLLYKDKLSNKIGHPGLWSEWISNDEIIIETTKDSDTKYYLIKIIFNASK